MTRFEKTVLAALALLCLTSGFLMLAFDAGPARAQSTPSSRALFDQVMGSKAVTCPDNGAGTAAACTLALDKPLVLYTCADAHGCDVTLSEVGASTGRQMHVLNVSANAVNLADTAGVSELAGAFAAGQWDALTVVYATDRWVELHRSNN